MKEERKGEIYIGLITLLWGLFPIITIASFSSVGPLFSLAATTFFAFMFFLVLAIVKNNWSALKNRSVLKDIFMVALFNGALFYVFFFIGLKYTSAGNASIISLVEIFYSFLFFNVFQGEKIPKTHIFGAMLMLSGAVMIFLPGVINNFSINIGDLLILIGVGFAPLGNHYARRARTKTNSEFIMLIRSFLAIPIVLLLAYLFGEVISISAIKGSLWLIIFNGVVLFGISKVFWIEAIHRISVTKAISLSSITPLFTLLFAYIFFHEPPTFIQLTSFMPLFFGAILLTRNNKPSKIISTK